MHVELKYGRHGLVVNVPDDAVILLPKSVPGLPDEAEAIRQALKHPLNTPPLVDLVSPGDRVAIVFSDITRPMPNDRVLPVLLAELERIPDTEIILINGVGTHRHNTPAELAEMLGPEIVARYQILQHDAWDDEGMVDLGTTRAGHRALVNRAFLEADVKILTGFIEPHIFAGFSGGPKAVLPAIAGINTIMDNHGFAMLNHPRATWGYTVGNPVWEEMMEVAQMAAPDLLLNVTLNRERQITGVFAGDLEAAHAQGVSFVREVAMVGVPEPFDVVLTTNSGYPLDINLYQSVKGMSAARRIVKRGGSIVIASECRNGIPDYGEYRSLIRKGGSLEGVRRLISQPGFRCHDQWEAQLQIMVQEHADVYVYADGLTDDQLREMLFEPCRDIEATIQQLLHQHGPNARLCVLPEGPQTIPYLIADKD